MDIRNKIANRQGFTLIELLVVIAVTGLLSSIIFVIVSGAGEQGRIAKGLYFSQHLHNSLGSYAAGVWSFDEGSGSTANDTSGWGNNGTLVNAPVWRCANTDINYTPSGQGCSLEFNGSTQYVNAGNSVSLRPDIVSIEAWVKYDGSGSFAPLVSWGNGYAPAVYLKYTAGNTKPIIILNSSNYKYFNERNLWNNSWHHVVFIIVGNSQADISNAEMYIDGVATTGSGDSNSNSPLAKSTPFKIGQNTQGYFNGLIDEVNIYATTLTTTQIQSQYYTGLNKLLAKGQINQEEYQQKLINI